MRYLLGIILFLAWFAIIAIASAGTDGALSFAIWFIDAPSLGSVYVIGVICIITCETEAFIAGAKALIFKKYQITDEMRARALRLYKLLRCCVNYSAVFFVIVSVVASMGALDSFDVIGVHIALALLPVFYAVIINMLFINPVIWKLDL